MPPVIPRMVCRLMLGPDVFNAFRLHLTAFSSKYRRFARGHLFPDTFEDNVDESTITGNEGAKYCDHHLELTPASDGLYHKDHHYQVWAPHIRTEQTLKARDGFFFSREHKLAFLLSEKAYFGKENMWDLYNDIAAIPKFRPYEWLFQVNKAGHAAPLTSLPQYSWMEKTDSFKLAGLGFSPNSHRLTLGAVPKTNPRVFMFGRCRPVGSASSMDRLLLRTLKK
ncbi:hypothetical protein BJ741DRAFT_388541 [Chytriomyces cf. hyalinus JEL632]|nr:hypothetical protein BJ741DRAFT_388541 [Chytriomyces cf. hyalinus JEL632]